MTPTNQNIDEDEIDKNEHREMQKLVDDIKSRLDGTLYTGPDLTAAKQSIKQLVTEARIDELKKLWNDYQYDIIPEGTQPLDIPGKAILDRITELEEGKA
jgi:hypothetical protein